MLKPRWKRAVEAALWFALGWIVPEGPDDSGHHGMGEGERIFLGELRNGFTHYQRLLSGWFASPRSYRKMNLPA